MDIADGDEYDALDEALMETFPASDPIAVSAATVRSEPSSAPAGSGSP